MGKAIIREGDPTSHGGTVLEAFPHLSVYGKNAAGVGHKGYCPQCKRDFVIVAGAQNVAYFGKNVAVEGMLTSCGATLIATQSQATIDVAPGGQAIMAGSLMASVLQKAAASTPSFDEQIKFVLPNNSVLANTAYALTLADGTTIEGSTDAEGKTQRIETDSAQDIVSAEFYQDMFYGCDCAADHMCEAGGRAPTPAMKVELKGIKTNSQAIGSSVVNHPLPAPDVRPMTAGEITMAKTVFKDAIDYSLVKIHKGGLFGQPDRSDNAMTPKGEIHFPSSAYEPDFSAPSVEPGTQVWFIHEMTHVWQYQLGYSVVWAGIKLSTRGGYSDDGVKGQPAPAYRYNLDGEDKGKTMPDFNMEQQAQLVSHYFGATVLSMSVYAKRLPGLRAALTRFINTPKDPTLLPQTTKVEPKP
ncbi:hypothetical protein DLM_1296 [Aquitalea magnusonii]|uniref:Uncharacterized protein n=2 Tax=Aquitalea magnusonii TaxID=332411 RepID=A0A3G9GAI3_9NEIS|nr:hypothetical protein DLM_1296 [Aquitalea magnusonii]